MRRKILIAVGIILIIFGLVFGCIGFYKYYSEKKAGEVYEDLKVEFDVAPLIDVPHVEVEELEIPIDFANLKRPMLFYMYDLDEYKDDLRGFYIDLNELPGPIVKTQEDLENEILNLDKYEERYKEKYIVFNNKFNYLDGKNCSKKVIDEIFKL